VRVTIASIQKTGTHIGAHGYHANCDY